MNQKASEIASRVSSEQFYLLWHNLELIVPNKEVYEEMLTLAIIYVFSLWNTFIISTFQQCPDSSSKNDLLAYIQRIALYSHQLTITARVKADVQMISGELVVSGVGGS